MASGMCKIAFDAVKPNSWTMKLSSHPWFGQLFPRQGRLGFCGAIITSEGFTIVMELVARGSIRTVSIRVGQC